MSATDRSEATNERTSLLHHGAEAAKHVPLPMGQITLLCLARLLEPICFFCIFVYCPQMVLDTGDVAEKDVGFATGVIESIFSLTQVIFLVFWGRLSDTVGRKPVLIVSLVGVGAAVLLFGFCIHVWQMVVCRSLAGVFAASIVVIRTSLAELSTEETQARAFAYFSLATNIGIFLGPLVGGVLSRPVLQYPCLFEGVTLFERFPYCLPSLFNGALAIIMAILMLFFLKETLPPHAQTQKADDKVDTSFRAILTIPGVVRVLAITATVGSMAFIFTAVVPVYSFTSVENGGLGFSPTLISIYLAVAGIAQACWILVFPTFHRRFGTLAILRWCCYVWPLCFLGVGILAAAVRRVSGDVFFYIFYGVATALGVGICMAFTCIQMCINHISPSPLYLGALNGLSSSVMSFTRIFVPVLATSLYSIGVKWGHLHGSLGWICICALAVGQIPLARSLPPEADSKPVRLSTNEEEATP